MVQFGVSVVGHGADVPRATTGKAEHSWRTWNVVAADAAAVIASKAPLAEGLGDELAFVGAVDPPERALARLVLAAGHLDEVAVQGEVVSHGVLQMGADFSCLSATVGSYLPTFIMGLEIRIVLADVVIDAVQCQLSVARRADSLHD